MKRYLFFLFLIIFIIGFSVWTIYLPKNPFSKKEVIFNVEKGQGPREISHNLAREDLIKWALIFRIYVVTTGVAGKLQAGKYLLSPAMNIPEIVAKFVKGDVIKEKITIIEGWNLKEIADYLKKRNVVGAEEFLEVARKDFLEDFDFIKDKPKNLDLQGYLFPDTYEINYGASAEEVVRKMLVNFDKKLTPDLRAEIKNQQKTIFEMVTMASLIDKEVKTEKDKKLVSGILWKRLEKGIPLQVDATISYITGKKTTKVSIEETKIDSPYNTYKYRGLPWGPISNPGLESILAAVYPESSKHWYYLSTPEGQTIFSKTLEEHNYARAKYLR